MFLAEFWHSDVVFGVPNEAVTLSSSCERKMLTLHHLLPPGVELASWVPVGRMGISLQCSPCSLIDRYLHVFSMPWNVFEGWEFT